MRKPMPKVIVLDPSLYGDGANGLALQQQRNDEWGVQLDAVRAKHGAAWVERWTSDFIPDREFKTFDELRVAHDALDRFEPYAARVLSVELRPTDRYAGTGGCWRCHAGVWTWTVRAQTGWRATDVDRVPSCDACLESVKADPVAAVAARVRWVREHPIKF